MTPRDFSAFFQAVHGVAPLPWQLALAKRLIGEHSWPDLIDLPTASGKTACIDIALFHLAACAERGEPWLAARRIVFVVDRRIIVDAAFERAVKISKALQESQELAVVSVRAALSKLVGGEFPLSCQKLRGGMPRERGIALDPAQPMVITSTVDQIGSRLLFRGYGLSPYSQPLHAGLLSHDTLILLDEAHLGVPFIETIAAVRREQARAERPFKNIQPVHLVPLSATSSTEGERFRLSAEDLENEVIRMRRTAPKHARLVEGAAKSANSGFTEHVKRLRDVALDMYKSIDIAAPAVAVIVNRVRTARHLFEELRANVPKDVDVELMIGRSRPLNRDGVAKRLIDRTAAGRKPLPGDRGIIVVATQTIEVGADLDFQGLITECASLDALRQRFGRLDRLGTFRRSLAAILGGFEEDDDPIYGAALNKTWHWLNHISTREEGIPAVDFSIAAIEKSTKGIDLQQFNSQLRKRLILTPSHVQLLCQTAPAPMYDPDVNALLHGLKTERPDIQVVWRADIPVVDERGAEMSRGDGRLVNTLLSLVPPTSLEALTLPASAVKTWLTDQAVSVELGDMEGVGSENDEVKFARRLQSRLVWRREKESWQLATAGSLRPGDTIVVPSVYGGCDEFGFDPTKDEPVEDLSERAREALKRERIVIVTKRYLLERFGSDRTNDVNNAWKAMQDAYESLRADPYDMLSVLLEGIGLDTPTELVAIDKPVAELLLDSDRQVYALILRTGTVGAEDISDEDISSSLTVPVRLEDHNRGVGERARNLALLVGLEVDLVQTVGCGGDVHDLGKADPRFQRLLRSGDNVTSFGEVLAKGLRRRTHQRVELGERHEAYSVAVLKKFPTLLSSAPDADLALYLVGTHHGRGRALMPFKDDEGTRFSVKVSNGETLEFEGVPRVGVLDSGWPVLFWKLVKRYGPWGLAYLESILRLADHLQSSDEVRKEGR